MSIKVETALGIALEILNEKNEKEAIKNIALALQGKKEVTANEASNTE